MLLVVYAAHLGTNHLETLCHLSILVAAGSQLRTPFTDSWFCHCFVNVDSVSAELKTCLIHADGD